MYPSGNPVCKTKNKTKLHHLANPVLEGRWKSILQVITPPSANDNSRRERDRDRMGLHTPHPRPHPTPLQQPADIFNGGVRHTHRQTHWPEVYYCCSSLRIFGGCGKGRVPGPGAWEHLSIACTWGWDTSLSRAVTFPCSPNLTAALDKVHHLWGGRWGGEGERISREGEPEQLPA